MSRAGSAPGPIASILAWPSIDSHLPPPKTQRVDDELLEILCCPVTRQALRIAGEAELVRASATACRTISEGLVREDGKILYPISDGIPLLIPEEGIPL
jgi:uncharacterized protein YbaR (Trm112 family)